MKKITSHLWFDREAKQAAEFYVSVFPNSEMNSLTKIHNTPSGDCDIATFTLADHHFQAISAGPIFKINPSISFFVNFDPSRDAKARENLEKLWGKLSAGGKVLMPLDKYPFSERYGWVQDKFGVSWQLILTNPNGEERPFIVPSLLFVGDVAGKAEEATKFYQSVFKDSKQGIVSRYGQGHEPDKAESVNYTDFRIDGQWFAAMDSAHKHDFKFNEGVSIVVHCKDQEEIDSLFKKLSSNPKFEQCGWLKDKYGVSWQIVPTVLNEMMNDKDAKKVERVTQAFLKMKKFDIETLKRAYEGK